MPTKSDIIEEYAQKVVEDMDIDDLMNFVKESIIDRMEDLTEIDALGEIKESVYADEILNKTVEVTLTLNLTLA